MKQRRNSSSPVWRSRKTPVYLSPIRWPWWLANGQGSERVNVKTIGGRSSRMVLPQARLRNQTGSGAPSFSLDVPLAILSPVRAFLWRPTIFSSAGFEVTFLFGNARFPQATGPSRRDCDESSARIKQRGSSASDQIRRNRE